VVLNLKGHQSEIISLCDKQAIDFLLIKPNDRRNFSYCVRDVSLVATSYKQRSKDTGDLARNALSISPVPCCALTQRLSTVLAA
jgi:hypothetical protein